ncbi:MAG: polysaccharide deacetylase family protein [Lachnospiraceae bacterium]|nr:polysaccharide deacetylase family protein [Lachnospiraceae bacterium]
MNNKKVRLFIFSVIFIVGLLFYFLGRTHGKEQQARIAARTTKTGNSIIVEKIIIEEDNAEPKKIALTFDDGPHPCYTEQLLDGLRERDVKATFFVTGEHAELHPDIIERMNEEGHLIGNHTYSHIQLSSRNRDEFKNQIVKTNEIINEITGKEVLYIRPPYGTWDKKFETELNMFPVLWTLDPLDWSSSNASRITDKVVSKADENDIILMHDYYESTVTAALNIIDKLKKEGYEFVTVDEILFD